MPDMLGRLKLLLSECQIYSISLDFFQITFWNALISFVKYGINIILQVFWDTVPYFSVYFLTISLHKKYRIFSWWLPVVCGLCKRVTRGPDIELNSGPRELIKFIHPVTRSISIPTPSPQWQFFLFIGWCSFVLHDSNHCNPKVYYVKEVK